MISQNIIESFIQLVTDGKPINQIDVCPTCKFGHYGPIGAARKEKFLKTGHAILHTLSLRLGCFGEGPYHGRWTMVNEAGGSSSGMVYLLAPTVHVTFSHFVNIGRAPLMYQKGFVFTDPREEDVAGWLPWENLANLDRCAIEIETQLALKLPFNWRAHLEYEERVTRASDVPLSGIVTKSEETSEEVGSELNSKKKQAQQ